MEGPVNGPGRQKRTEEAMGDAMRVIPVAAGEIEESSPAAYRAKNSDYTSRAKDLAKRFPKILARLAQ